MKLNCLLLSCIAFIPGCNGLLGNDTVSLWDASASGASSSFEMGGTSTVDLDGGDGSAGSSGSSSAPASSAINSASAASSSSGSSSAGSSGSSSAPASSAVNSSSTGSSGSGSNSAGSSGSSSSSVDGGPSSDAGPQDAAGPCNDAAPENCIDGLDNDCNGKIDCADQPACSSYGCAPAPPSSWLGPAVLWTGAGTATLPACPAGYPTAIDGFSGLTFANDTCTCQCNATAQTCSATALIYASMNCGGACATLPLASGTCATFSCAGELGAWQVTAPVSATGQCTAVPTTTSGGPPTWKTAVRVCTSTGTTNRAGGCSTATDECLPIAAAPFGAPLCVYQTGTQATCPAPYNHTAKPFVYSTGAITDTRGCSACTCGGTPTAGTCSGGVHLYGTTNCTGTAVASGPGCQQFNDPFGVSPQAVEASYSSTPGTCPAPSIMPQPTGAITATGAFSVCCM